MNDASRMAMHAIHAMPARQCRIVNMGGFYHRAVMQQLADKFDHYWHVHFVTKWLPSKTFKARQVEKSNGVATEPMADFMRSALPGICALFAKIAA